MSEFIKVKDQYIRKASVVAFRHGKKVLHRPIDPRDEPTYTEGLWVALVNNEEIFVEGHKTLLGQFAKHFEDGL